VARKKGKKKAKQQGRGVSRKWDIPALGLCGELEPVETVTLENNEGIAHLRCRNPVAGGTDSRGSFASTHCQQHMSDVCLEKEKDNGK
jgi:hypothetical protein